MKNTSAHTTQRLIVVASYFHPKIGGLETIAYTTAKMLHQSGAYAVSIITSNYDGKGYRKDVIDGMTVHRLPIGFKISNTPINLRWPAMIRNIFLQEKPDIIHTHSPVPFMADVAVSVAGKMNIPSVVTYHSGSMKKGSLIPDLVIGAYEGYFLRKLFERASAIVAVSKNFIPVVFPQFINKTSFIPTGVDLGRFKKTPVPENEIVAYVGRVERSSSWKGIDQLLKAMAIVAEHRPDARLKIIGGGDALEMHRQQAADLGIADILIAPGPQYGQDLVDCFEEMRVMVLPSVSDSEAFSVSLVEAMASGRPVIGTAIGGTPGVIDDEKTGLLVEPKDPVGLASAIERILHDHAFAQRLGDAGAEKAQDFSWEIQTSKYQAIFNKLLR